MRRPSLLPRAVALSLALLAGAACGADRTLVGPAETTDLRLPVVGASAPSLLRCEPPAASQTVSALIGPLGGTLQLGNTRVVIPEDAVLAPTTFTLTIPQSPLVEISVRAGDAEHYVFALPVTISIDYSRCAGSLGGLDPVSAWHIDESTKRLLENMGGVDLRLVNTVTFLTGHLSGYAVAD